ncbi:hypothetical protein EKK58_11550 [Candidatus Dependentiae bacterium]|nr:MAG: hypothetical protein EKK58_11550 [Candidatus Dependentiae bacterium]
MFSFSVWNIYDRFSTSLAVVVGHGYILLSKSMRGFASHDWWLFMDLPIDEIKLSIYSFGYEIQYLDTIISKNESDRRYEKNLG